MLAYSFENGALHPIKRRETEPAAHYISKRLSRNAYGCRLLTEHSATGINWELLLVCWSPDWKAESSSQLDANQMQVSRVPRSSGKWSFPRAWVCCAEDVAGSWVLEGEGVQVRFPSFLSRDAVLWIPEVWFVAWLERSGKANLINISVLHFGLGRACKHHM